MKPIELVLSRFPNNRKDSTGRYWVRCPSHDDKKASLAISEGREGRVLVKCFADCPIENILAVLGLEMKDLFSDNGEVPQQNTSRRSHNPPQATLNPMAEYIYKDEFGKSVAIHGRFEPEGKDKYFLWRLPEGRYEDGLGGLHMAELPLWGLPDLIARPLDDLTGFVEGEKAAQACREHGLFAVCLGGGSSQKDFGEALKPLEGRRVALWPDNDDAGRTYMARIKVSLRPLAAEIIEFSPPVAPKGDAFDFFEAGGTLETLKTAIPPVAPIVEVKDSETFHVSLPGSLRLEFSNTEAIRRTIDTDLAVVIRDKQVYSQRINLLSSSQRTELRRELDGYLGKEYGWTGILSDAFELVRTALAGQSSSLRVARVPEPGQQAWAIPKFLPAGVPSLFFGEEGTTKSFLALMAGLCIVLGETFLGCRATSGGVLYVDYEDTAEEFARRVRQMWQGLYSDVVPGSPLPDIPYIRRDPGGRAFWDIADDIRREVTGEGLSLVIVDCVDGAVLGDLKESSAANRYFAALDKIGVTSLSIAHITKAAAEQGKSDRHKPFGVTQWNAKPRRTWFVARADSVGSVVDVGLYCRKVNTGQIPGPVGARWTFGTDTIRLEGINIREMGSLNERRALKWQIWDALTEGMTPSEVSEAVGAAKDSVGTILRREKSLFVAQDGGEQGGRTMEKLWFRLYRGEEG